MGKINIRIILLQLPYNKLNFKKIKFRINIYVKMSNEIQNLADRFQISFKRI